MLAPAHWRAAKIASRLCYQRDPPVDDDAAGTPQHERVTFLFFFNAFGRGAPKRARSGQWFAHTARIVSDSRCRGRRAARRDARDATGVSAVPIKWHRLSFNKALSLCVFDTPHFS